MKQNKTLDNQRRILADNIKKLLKTKGKTQTDMAKELGLSETTVSSWLNGGRYPRIDKIQLMADYFGVYRSAITEDDSNTIQETKTTYNYFPRSVSAGLPTVVDPITNEDLSSISIPDAIMGKWAGNRDVYMLRVNGDSMNKVIPNGSLIGVKKTELDHLKNGDIVVYSDGNEYSVKRFYQYDSHIVFRPDSHDIRFTDHVSPKDNNGLRIHGKVVVYIVELD
ncbi:LexA family protein [Terribacillus sp. JSM ZJ617]|uniref:LexA family protein n=1 Tax=Terribacillus sp. JSM ZJ617 TaxID=3342119 RepID=UPI0035A831F2